MRPKLVIRPMTAKDIPAVAEMEKALFRSPWPEKSFEYEVASNPHSYQLVAEHDEEVIGYLVAWFLIDELQIATIGVKPEWQGKGIGTLLMIAAIEWALAKGASSITLEVRPSNIRAIKLYEKLGFRVVGRREHYYRPDGEDALLMTNLNPDAKGLESIWSQAAAHFELETNTGGSILWEDSTN